MPKQPQDEDEATRIASESVLTSSEAVNLLGLLNGNVAMVEQIAAQASLTAAAGLGYGFASAVITILQEA